MSKAITFSIVTLDRNSRGLTLAWIVLVTATLWVGCAKESVAVKRSAAAVATSGEQRAVLRSANRLRNEPKAQLGRYLDAAAAARSRMAASPDDVSARADYNFAIARIVEIVEVEDFEPWKAPIACPSDSGATWNLVLPPPDPRPEYHPSKFEILPADRYDFRGKLVGERKVKDGLGAPTVVVGRDFDFTENDQFAQGKQVYYGLTAVGDFDGATVTLRLLDPLSEETVHFDGREFPLAADFQAPLAFSLAELKLKKWALQGFLRPAEFNDAARLARLQPYDPTKIPVVCIHGLGDSPATWAPVIEHLRGDSEIRKNYQFWFFAFPSGIAYPMVTAILRHQLDQFNETYPDHKDIVVIGHSTGGMIARLLISENGTRLWDAYYDRPPDAIPFSEWPRVVMSRTLIFDPREDVGRVIFASASHRGSDKATNFLGCLGAKLVGDPIADQSITEEAIRFVRPEILEDTRLRHLPNSVQVLDPDNLFLQLVDSLPVDPNIPFHSIIGDRGKGGNLDRNKPQSSDGVVPYWSSHLDGAESELIIPSEHWSHLHPEGMAEIRRILLLHAAAR